MSFRKRDICKKRLSDETVYKISSCYLEKRLSFAVLNVRKGHFLRYSRGFWHFPIFKFCPIWDVQKVFWCIFLRYWRKSYLKTSITTPKLKILKIELFDPVTLDDLDLTKGRKRLRMVRRSIPETIHVVPPALFQFATAALPGESSND